MCAPKTVFERPFWKHVSLFLSLSLSQKASRKERKPRLCSKSCVLFFRLFILPPRWRLATNDKKKTGDDEIFFFGFVGKNE